MEQKRKQVESLCFRVRFLPQKAILIMDKHNRDKESSFSFVVSQSVNSVDSSPQLDTGLPKFTQTSRYFFLVRCAAVKSCWNGVIVVRAS